MFFMYLCLPMNPLKWLYWRLDCFESFSSQKKTPCCKDSSLELTLLQSPVQLTPWRKGRFNPCWRRKTPGQGKKISQVFPSYYSYVDPVAKWKICSYHNNIVNHTIITSSATAVAILLPPAAALPSAVASIHCRFLLLLVLCTAVPGWCRHPLPFIPTMYANPTLQNKRPPVCPLNGMLAEEPKHPSNGGRQWPIEIRNMVISMHLSGDNFWDATLVRMRANYEFPSMRSVYRWIRQYNFEGTAHMKCTTGNRQSTPEVNGVDLVNLALFWLERPKA